MIRVTNNIDPSDTDTKAPDSGKKEMSLKEWCGQLHDHHTVNKELRELEAKVLSVQKAWNESEKRIVAWWTGFMEQEQSKLQDKITELERQNKILRLACEKIADPRKRHSEPDKYTELGCVMNIADQALKDSAMNDKHEGQL